MIIGEGSRGHHLSDHVSGIEITNAEHRAGQIDGNYTTKALPTSIVTTALASGRRKIARRISLPVARRSDAGEEFRVRVNEALLRWIPAFDYVAKFRRLPPKIEWADPDAASPHN